MAKQILFITTLNLASNPRLVKEIDLALNNKYCVTVICFEFHNWSKRNNDELISRFNTVKFIIISSGKSPFLPWLKNVLKEKIYRFLGHFIPLSLSQISQAVSRRSDNLIKALKNIEYADLVIGHNPAAIYPALVAAKKFNCGVGFDVEDYHPGEGTNTRLSSLTLQLMRRTLLDFDYVSYASTSIKSEFSQKIAGLENQNNLVINNSFSEKEFSFFESISDNKLQLVWFSQNVDKNRGLEYIIPIVDRHNDCMNLTLFGNADPDFKMNHSKYNGVNWAGVTSQLKLHQQLTNFDIGLALEPGKDRNNELALSNKLFAYLLAGLNIVATDTIEQIRFLSQYSNLGSIVKKDFSNAESILLNLAEAKNKLRSERLDRYKSNQVFSWEIESQTLLQKWNSILSN